MRTRTLFVASAVMLATGTALVVAQQQAAEKTADKGNPFGNPDGAEVDYEKAAEQLNLPKDFSQFLK